jgi:hypothetical protein
MLGCLSVARPAERRVACNGEACSTAVVVTIFGVVALTFMIAMYALEHRGARFILAFAVGCALSSTYGFLSGAWPFGVVEAIWCGVALRRFAAVAEG